MRASFSSIKDKERNLRIEILCEFEFLQNTYSDAAEHSNEDALAGRYSRVPSRTNDKQYCGTQQPLTATECTSNECQNVYCNH